MFAWMHDSVKTSVPNADIAVRRHGPAGSLWLEGIDTADPLADVVAATFATLPRGAGMAMLRAATEQGVDAVEDAPDSLRAFFSAVDDEPEWLDHDRLDRAAGHLVRHMASYGIVLGAASLTAGAMNSTAGMPLVMTGRYTSQAAVRSLEVGSWLETILTPGGLRRHGTGFATTLRVRMIHALVRRHLWNCGEWDSQAWGAPIPQSFMAFTIAEFGHIALAAMHKLGVRYSDAELDDIYHFWRYVGLLNGVGDLNPATDADHIRIEELYALTATDPDDGDRDFVRALTRDYLAVEMGELFPIGGQRRHEWAVSVVNGLTRSFLGDAAAAKLGVPDTALKHLPLLLSPIVGGANRAIAAVPGANALRTKRALANHSRIMFEQRQRYNMTHDLVDAAPDQEEHPATSR